MQDTPASAANMSAASTSAHGRRSMMGKVVRYGTGSVVATVCSYVTFLLVYGPFGASTTWASILGWLAGAVPNYVLNRSWAWGLRGRPSLRREVLPYVVIVLVTLLLAVLTTGWADRLLDGMDISDLARTLIVSLVFLGVYAVVFIARFLLFDRLFTGLHAPDGTPTTGDDDD
jgi:putative flippase GtrA